jgi:hypothetical protein
MDLFVDHLITKQQQQQQTHLTRTVYFVIKALTAYIQYIRIVWH